MKTSGITVDSDDDLALYYRYDGVDENGQHYLERIEYDEDGEEVYTEEYIPIAFWNRGAFSTIAAKDKRIAELEAENDIRREELEQAVTAAYNKLDEVQAILGPVL